MQVEELKQRIDELTAENAELRSQVGQDITDLRIRHCATVIGEALRERREDSRSAADVAAIAALNCEVDSLTFQLNQLHTTSSLQRARIEEGERELEHLHETLERLEGSVIPNLHAEIREAVEERDELHRQVLQSRTSADSEVASLKAIAEEYTELNGNLRMQLDARESVIQEYSAKLAEFMNSSRSTSTAVKEAQLAVQERTEERDNYKIQLEMAIADHQRTVENVKQDHTLEVDALSRDKNHFKARCEELSIELEKALANLAQQTRANSQRDEEAESLPQVGQKRPRDDGAPAVVAGSRMKEEMIRFWVEGHNDIDELKAVIEKLEAKIKAFEAKAGEVRNVLATRSKLVDSLCALTLELERSREECRAVRSQVVAGEAENELLTTHLSMLLEGSMAADELQRCAASVRDSAAKKAAATASIVYDAEALKKAMKDAQTLKHDISQLRNQKELLQRSISDRERALAAVNATLGNARLTARVIMVGNSGVGRITVEDLTAIFRDLQSPYQIGAADLEHKNKALQEKASLAELQEVSRSQQRELELLKRELNDLRTDKAFNDKAAAAEAAGLREELAQSQKSLQALGVANRKLKARIEVCEAENSQLSEVSNQLQGTGLQLIALFTKELAQSQSQREVIRSLRDRLASVEGAAESSWSKLSESDAHAMVLMLNRHCAAIEQQLQLEARRLEASRGKQDGEALKAIEAKDALISEASAAAANAGKHGLATIQKLESELRLNEAQLSEARSWASSLEAKLADIDRRVAEASQYRQFISGKIAQSWLAPPGGKPKPVPQEVKPSYVVPTANAQQVEAMQHIKLALSGNIAPTQAPATETLTTEEQTNDEEPAPALGFEPTPLEQPQLVDSQGQEEGDDAPGFSTFDDSPFA